MSVISLSAVSYAAGSLNPDALGAAAAAAAAPAPMTPLAGPLSLIVAGGYVLVFFGMMAEGPMTTAAAAFAATLGYFNVWIIFSMAIGADLTGDILFYMLGRVTRASILEKHGKKVGLPRERLMRMERLLRAHPRKTILAFKLLPGLPAIGLPLVGALRVPLRTYMLVCLSFIVPSAIFFTSLGYFFGQAYATVTAYVQNAEYFMLFALVAALLIYYGFTKTTARLGRWLEPI